MPKPKRHVWEEGSTHRAVSGKEYDEVWDYVAELEKYLKHARDDKEIRLKEIEVLEAEVKLGIDQKVMSIKHYNDCAVDEMKLRLLAEAENAELRELSQVKVLETAGGFVERRIQDIFQEVAEHVGNGLFELDHPATIIRGSIRMTNAWKEYLDELDSE